MNHLVIGAEKRGEGSWKRKKAKLGEKVYLAEDLVRRGEG